MALNKRPLGRSGLEITTVGIGTWAVGGGGWSFGWGAQDDEHSIAAIRRGVELDINWVDTAAIYGLGHSEEVVGRALKEIPASQRPFVFTKCGLIADKSKPFEMPQRNLRPESIRRECEASLKRLGVDRIDLYQFHWPDDTGTPVEDSWGEMARLIKEGKVRAGGVSNFTVETARAMRARAACRFAAASFLRHPARFCRGRHSLVRGARYRRHRLQPHASRAAHR